MGRWTPRAGAWLGALLLSLVAATCGPAAPAYETRIEYQVVPARGEAPTVDELEATRRIIEQRLDSTGIAAFQVTAGAPDRIVVEASPASVTDDVRSLAGRTGRVEFVPLADTGAEPGQVLDTSMLPPLFTGDWLAEASVTQDETGNPVLSLRLRDPAAHVFADWTTAHIGEVLGVVLDGVIVAAPVILAPIDGGEVDISGPVGDPSSVSVDELVTLLRLGPLPHPVREVPPG